jgi:hypothetical protein
MSRRLAAAILLTFIASSLWSCLAIFGCRKNPRILSPRWIGATSLGKQFPLVFCLISAALVSSDALAGCREDPREVRVDQAYVVRLKSYLCSFEEGGNARRIKIEYHRFANETASGLVSGQFAEYMTKIFGKTEIIHNDVYNKFKYMVDKYSTTEVFDSKDLDAVRTLVHINQSDDSAFTSADKLRSVRIEDNIGPYPAVSELESLNAKTIPNSINVFYAQSGATTGLQAIFWRYQDITDIENYRANSGLLKEAAQANSDFGQLHLDVDRSTSHSRKFLSFLQYLSEGAGLPKEFLILWGRYNAAACTDPSWEFETSSPNVTLEMLVIRNESGRAINVDSLLGEESPDLPLRVASKIDSASTATTARLSVARTIAPGQSLLIPSRIILRSAFAFDNGQPMAKGVDVYNRLRAKGISARSDVFAVPSLHDYTFGPELKVSGAVVENAPVQFADLDGNLVDISNSGGAGSCPYLLSWDSGQAEWLEHGKILHGSSDKRLEASQSVVMPGFVARYRLEEREPEVATIDGAELTLSLKNGDTIALRPADAQSSEPDPFRLFWGETKEFGFQLPAGVAVADVVQSSLSLTGYYQRYSSLPNSDLFGRLARVRDRRARDSTR